MVYLSGITSNVQTQLNNCVLYSGSTTTLQQAYDNSSEPEIITDSTHSAVSIRNGQTLDTSTILEGKNISGTTTFSVDGNGMSLIPTIYGSTVSGGTLSLRGNNTDLTNGQVNVLGTKDATSSSEASLTTAGGLGVAKNVAIGGNVGIGRAPHAVWKTVIGDATTDDTKLYVGKTDIIDNTTVKDYMAVFRMTPNNDSTGILLSRDVYGGISIGTGVSAGFGIATTNPYGGEAVDMIEFGTAGATATGRWLMLGTGSNYQLYPNKNVGSDADTVIHNNALNPTRVVARVAGTATQTGDLFDVGILTNSTTFNKKFIISKDGNTSGNNFINRRETQATTGGTTTLTVANAQTQEFTGTLNQTVVLPVVSTLLVNTTYRVSNQSTGIITVQSSGLNTILTIPSGYVSEVRSILITGTTETSWSYSISQSNDASLIVKNLSVIGKQNLQDGTSSGGLVIGADVNANTITSGVRKLARITMPSLTGTTNTSIIDGDISAGGVSTVTIGAVEGYTTLSPNEIYFGTNTGATVGGITRMVIDSAGKLTVKGASEFQDNVKFTGNGTYWDDIHMNPTNMTGGGTHPSRILFAGTTIGVAAFSPTSIDEVEESVELPHRWKLGSPISFHLHQYPTNTNTGTVRYGLEYFFTQEGVDTTTSTTIYIEVPQSGTAWAKKSSAFADITPPSELGTQFHFRFFRDATHVNDTYNANIAISTIGIHFESDSLGSNTISTK